MSVVISEFEVVAEADPAADRRPAPQPATDPAAKQPAMNDIARVAQLLAERALRVWTS